MYTVLYDLFFVLFRFFNFFSLQKCLWLRTVFVHYCKKNILFLLPYFPTFMNQPNLLPKVCQMFYTLFKQISLKTLNITSAYSTVSKTH